MWHGERARLHPGTIVNILDPKDKQIHQEPAIVQKYDSQKKKWLVTMEHKKFQGKQVLVTEKQMSLVYCLIPKNCISAKIAKAFVTVEDAQGDCGGGLIAAGPCPRGEFLFEEHPFVITPTGLNVMWEVRWRAYMMLQMAAHSGDPAAETALAAFDQLTPGTTDDKEGTRKVLEEATKIYEDAAGMAKATQDPTVRDNQIRGVFSALMKWQSNQFKFENGLSSFGASAVYAFTAKMNHSCAPTVILQPQWTAANPGTLEPEDGRIVARAACDMEAGARLCISYGPADLVNWPLAKRRAYLLKNNGFACLCARCVQEEEAEAKAQAERATSAGDAGEAGGEDAGLANEWTAHLNLGGGGGGKSSGGKRKSSAKGKKKK